MSWVMEDNESRQFTLSIAICISRIDVPLFSLPLSKFTSALLTAVDMIG